MPQIKELTHEHRVNTVSNWLSISRIILAPIVCILLWRNAKEIFVFVLIGIMALTDFFDGYFARKLHQVTSLGKLLDPIADKIAIAMIAITLLFVNNMYTDGLFIGLLILMFSRDFTIFLLGVYLIRKKDLIPGPNIFGKISTAALLLMFVWLLFVRVIPALTPAEGRGIVTTILMLVALTSLALSSISYLVLFIRSVARSERIKKTPSSFERR